jgi:DNA-binding transcriptional regulator GbsR (MarR family)
MEDIAKKTGYSLASISNTMKMLESIGFVERRRRPKSKKVYFYMGKNIIKWNINKMVYASENMIRPAKEKLPTIIKEYKGKAKSEKDKKKVQIVQNYLNQIFVFENIINKWRKDLEKLI